MQATITLKEVLDFLDTGEECTLAIVTDDQERNTGGEWIEMKNVHKAEYVTKAEKEKMKKAQPEVEVFRNPDHYPNSIRNVVFRSGEVRTIAIRLIRRFNGKTVT